MNILEVTLEPDYSEVITGKLHLKVMLTIDAVSPLQCEDDDFDIRELINSVKRDGDYFIWTCSCGVAGCAGYHKGLHVTNEKDHTTWEDRDLDKRYVFDTTALKHTIKTLNEDLLKWNSHAVSVNAELHVYPFWTMKYLLPAINR